MAQMPTDMVAERPRGVLFPVDRQQVRLRGDLWIFVDWQPRLRRDSFPVDMAPVRSQGAKS
jgi:hypothetical protein